MAATVWIVAQVRTFTDEGWALEWDLGGVFTTEAKALAACKAPGDAMWSMQLDEPVGRPRVEPPGITYPAALNKK